MGIDVNVCPYSASLIVMMAIDVNVKTWLLYSVLFFLGSVLQKMILTLLSLSPKHKHEIEWYEELKWQVWLVFFFINFFLFSDVILFCFFIF